jgi:hypothetical protein
MVGNAFKMDEQFDKYNSRLGGAKTVMKSFEVFIPRFFHFNIYFFLPPDKAVDFFIMRSFDQ